MALCNKYSNSYTPLSMPLPTVFGQRLLEAREARGWTQAELARRAMLPAMMISHYETGARANPSLITLQRLADALEVAIEWLLGRTDEKTPVSGPLAALFRSAAEQKGERLDAIKSVLRSLTEEPHRSGRKDK